MSQNVRLFHVSNLSVRNFRIYLLMYTGPANHSTKPPSLRAYSSDPTTACIYCPAHRHQHNNQLMSLSVTSKHFMTSVETRRSETETCRRWSVHLDRRAAADASARQHFPFPLLVALSPSCRHDNLAAAAPPLTTERRCCHRTPGGTARRNRRRALLRRYCHVAGTARHGAASDEKRRGVPWRGAAARDGAAATNGGAERPSGDDGGGQAVSLSDTTLVLPMHERYKFAWRRTRATKLFRDVERVIKIYVPPSKGGRVAVHSADRWGIMAWQKAARRPTPHAPRTHF